MYIDPMYQYDLYLLNMYKNLIHQKDFYVIGIDEAGRGSLAGSVFASACVLNLDSSLHYVQVFDSKAVNFNKRRLIYTNLKKKILLKKTASVSARIIDKINVSQASLMAMLKSLLKILVSTIFNKKTKFIVLIDGNQAFIHLIKRKLLKDLLKSCYFVLIPKGDSKSASIAAASIIAKCKRDAYMMHSIHLKYPNYRFDKHKGYCTKEHLNNIKKYKICNIHRKSFIPDVKYHA